MPRKKHRILLVNDDAHDLRLLRDALREASGEIYDFVEVHSGQAALVNCFSDKGGWPDCAIVDLHLPDMTGLDLINQLSEPNGDVPLPVMLFIDTGEECKAATAALRAGAQDYIAKSWLTPDGLACAVENTIERFELRRRLRLKRATVERQEREFRALVENVPDIIAHFDTTHRHLYINPAIESAFGLPTGRFLGKTIREIGLPADLCEKWEINLTEVARTGHESTFEFSFEGPRGHRHYRARLVPQLDSAGRLESILGVSTEITEAKRAEEALRSGKDHLRHVIDRLIAFVGVMTPDGILVEINRPALDIASLEPNDVLGKPLESTYWLSYSPKVQADVRRAIDCSARGETVRYDLVIRVAEDRTMTVDFMLAPLKDESGRVTHLIASAVDITGRQRAEEAMRKIAVRERVRSAELQAVLRAAPAAIWISKDRECRRIEGNPASYKLLKAPENSNVSATAQPRELANRNFQEYRGGEPLDASELPMQLVASQGIDIQGTELTLQFQDGSMRHIYGNATPLREPDGEIYGAISAFIDITNLREAEEAVRVSVNRFRLASEAVNGLIYDWNRTNDTVERSAGLVDLTGYRPEEVPPTVGWWRERIHPDDLLRAMYSPVITETEHGTLQEFEYRVRHRDGTYRHVWDRGRVVYDETGMPSRIVGYTIDITERVKGEEALRLSEKRFRRFATSDIIGIVFGDVQGRLHYVNDEYLRIMGYSRERFESDGLLWTDLTPQEWRNADERGIAEATSKGSCTPYEKEYLRADGTRIPVLIGYTLLDECGDDMVAFILDVSERNRAELALRQADRRKDEFLAMLAHELRNPLAAIRTAIHILLVKGSDEPQLKWGHEVIDRQAKHLTRLIEDLLDVSRISTGKIQVNPVPLDFRDIISRAVESTWPLMAAKQHDLTIDLPPQSLPVLGDPARLEQVVSNLLTNAAKYTDNQGSISLGAQRNESTIVLTVRDNGIGISHEMLPLIFELYTQVDGHRARSLGGLGIGLTLVKMLVEMHGGSVAAHSEGPGRGSEFTLHLPALEASPTPPVSSSSDSATVPQGPLAPWRPRVLVVDDHVDMATGLAMLIEASGYEVKTAHDGRSALGTALHFRPDFVLLDINLPQMSGNEVAMAFRRDIDLRVSTLIAISGYGQDQDRVLSLSSGFDYHLLKPVDLEVLLPILRSPEPAKKARDSRDR